MPLIKSAKKRVRISEHKHSINLLQRVGAKTAVRLASNAASSGSDDAGKLANVAVSRLDRAAAKGVIHKNKAARLKSRLAAKLKTAGASTETAPKAKAKAIGKKAATKKPAAKKSK